MLNNEENILDRLAPLIPEAMKHDIIPFKARNFLEIGLPIVPKSPLWRNSWRNSDYGTYYVRSLMPELHDNDWIVQIDNDVIASIPWSVVLARLPLDSIDFFSKKVFKVGEWWAHYRAAKIYYANNDIGMTLFGLQGYRVELVDSLYKKRLAMSDFLGKYLQEIDLDLHNLTPDQAQNYWPLCEAYIGTEILNARYRTLDLESYFEKSFDFYELNLSKVDFRELNKKTPNSVFFFHPIKEPIFESLYQNLISLQDYSKSFSTQAVKDNFAHWTSHASIFLHPNLKKALPITRMIIDLKDNLSTASTDTLFGIARLVENAQAQVVVSCDIVYKDNKTKQVLYLKISAGEVVPFCFFITHEVKQIIFYSESASVETAVCCHFRLTNLFVSPG